MNKIVFKFIKENIWLISVVILLIIFSLYLFNNYLDFWLLINKFFSCENTPWYSFPCYWLYWILAFDITILLSIFSLILLIIKYLKINNNKFIKVIWYILILGLILFLLLPLVSIYSMF